MELPINTIVILIVLLVVLAIMLILITRSGTNLVDIGDVKIDSAGGASECQLNCYQCCNGIDSGCDEISGLSCGCKLNRQNC